MPTEIQGTQACPNGNCVSNHERSSTRFDVVSADPLLAGNVELQTMQYSTRPVYANGRRIIGWVARQSLRLESTDAEALSEADAIIGRGSGLHGLRGRQLRR